MKLLRYNEIEDTFGPGALTCFRGRVAFRVRSPTAISPQAAPDAFAAVGPRSAAGRASASGRVGCEGAQEPLQYPPTCTADRAAVRQAAILVGAPIHAPRKGGGLNLRMLDELLRDATLTGALSEDITTYFRALLTDARARNIRN